MRALGAQKPFVWLMFLVETLTITVVFGVIGIGLRVRGGGRRQPDPHPRGPTSSPRSSSAARCCRLVVSPVSFLTTLLMVAGVGLVSHLYPVIVALKIPPVRAMQNE